jgi:FtsZ-binding cell division protein ZapB
MDNETIAYVRGLKAEIDYLKKRESSLEQENERLQVLEIETQSAEKKHVPWYEEMNA